MQVGAADRRSNTTRCPAHRDQTCAVPIPDTREARRETKGVGPASSYLGSVQVYIWAARSRDCS